VQSNKVFESHNLHGFILLRLSICVSHWDLSGALDPQRIPLWILTNDGIIVYGKSWRNKMNIRNTHTPRKISNKNKLGATAVSWLGGNHNLVTNIWTEATLQQFPRVIKSNFLGGYVRECCWCYPAELTVRYDHWCWICIKLCTNKEKDSTMQLIELFDASVSCQYVSTKINGALITNIMLIQKLKPRDITISAARA